MHSPQADLTPAPKRGAANEDGTIFVLLPVHNRRAVTEGFVRCLLAQEDRNFHLVLIDDGSTDGTSEAISAMLPTTVVLSGTGSWWWAGSLQRGYRWLVAHRLGPSDLVLIANDDTRFGPEFLTAARMALTRRSLLLAHLYDQTSDEFVELGVHVDWRRLQFTGVKDARQVNCFSTRGLFLYADDFVALGGFHPRLLPHYLSDYEFTIRARRLGYRLRSDPSLRLRYDASATGIRSSNATSVRGYVAEMLSPRAANNPIHWTAFLILSCPRRHLLRNLFRVWRAFVSGLMASRRTMDAV